MTLVLEKYMLQLGVSSKTLKHHFESFASFMKKIRTVVKQLGMINSNNEQ